MVVVVCGMVTASVALGGEGWPLRCGGVSVWLGVGDVTGPSSLQPPMLQPWMVMGLGRCIQSRGLRGSGFEGPMQDTVLDWIPYPQGTEHWKAVNTVVILATSFIKMQQFRCWDIFFPVISSIYGLFFDNIKIIWNSLQTCLSHVVDHNEHRVCIMFCVTLSYQ